MKALICATLFDLSLLTLVPDANVAKPDPHPVWDTSQQQFGCAAPADSKEKVPDNSTPSRDYLLLLLFLGC